MNSSSDLNLITYRDPKSAIGEAYRVLRTNIQFANLDKDIKTMVVTSSSPTEGKTTITSNLGITMARGGKKVLLIDGDLRRPRLHKVFSINNNIGLTHLVMGVNLSDVVYNIDSIGVDLITSGPLPPNPSELLGSKKIKYFLDECKERYDIILVDSPPVGVVTDGAILSAICDGTILVVAANQTSIDDSQKAKDALNKVKANIIGVVLNKVKISRRDYRNYYGQE